MSIQNPATPPSLAPITGTDEEITKTHQEFWQWLRVFQSWLVYFIPFLEETRDKVDDAVNASDLIANTLGATYAPNGWNYVDDFHGKYTPHNGYLWVSITPTANIANEPNDESNEWTRVINQQALAHHTLHVETVGDLASVDGGAYPFVSVREELRGGEFYYDPSQSNNDGTVIGNWVRRFNGNINPCWFGAKGDGLEDDYAAIANCLNYCDKGKYVDGLGKTYLTSAAIIVPSEVSVENMTIIGGSTILHSEAVISFNGDYTSPSGSASRLTVNCLSTDAVGLKIEHPQVSYFNQIEVLNHRNNGIVLEAGYGLFLDNYKTEGRHKADGGPLNNTIAGVVCKTSDSYFSSGYSVKTPVGMDMIGGNNDINNVHNWSTFDNEQRMGFCFKISGQTNTFSQCTADSMDCFNGDLPVSFENGGYGFYVYENAVKTSFMQCRVFMPNFANHPTNKIIAMDLEKAYTRVTDFVIRDEAGAMSSNPFIVPYDGVFSNVDGIDDSALVKAKLSRPIDINLGIDGNYENTVYTERKAHFIEKDEYVEWSAHFKVSTTGDIVGNVTVEGIPFPARDYGNAGNYFGTGFIDDYGSITCKLIPSNSVIFIFNNDGTLLNNNDLPNDKNINISITYVKD